MKKLALLISAILGLLSGCVAYDTPYREGGDFRNEHRADRDHEREHERDRDRDERRSDDYRR